MSLLPGQVIHGRYRVIALLIESGMSAVYEAMDITLDVRCALKEMVPYPGTLGAALPQLREQFRQEAQVLAELRHPNLPRVTDYFEEDGSAYLIMDFIYGKRLDEIIAQRGNLTEDEVLGWARQLMRALAYCHEQGVIHRDVKPQNVIITSRGQAVLVDFGLAKLVNPNNPRTRTVMQGLGTPEYAPPEQYDTRKGRTDPRTDVYSLGATLYHALTGELPPMLAERVVDPTSMIPVRQRRDDVSQVTDQAIMKAMTLQPSQRFQSVAEMHKALFGSLPPELRAENIVLSGIDATLSAEPSKATVSLPWIGATGLRVDYRLGAALVVIVLVSLAAVISVVTGRISIRSVPTATATPTVFVTMTSTHTPTVTPSSTPTLTASPTSRPPTRRPTEVPEELEFPHRPVWPVLASPTPTRVYVPLPTHTSTPTSVPTSTPQPRRPRLTRTSAPTPTDTPTNIPTDAPTVTSTPPPTVPDTPTATPTVRPTLTPSS